MPDPTTPAQEAPLLSDERLLNDYPGSAEPEMSNREVRNFYETERQKSSAEHTRLLGIVQKLEEFKAYVHSRLDDAGIPTHPEGPHSAAGCRIGDRLDIALAKDLGITPTPST